MNSLLSTGQHNAIGQCRAGTPVRRLCLGLCFSNEKMTGSGWEINVSIKSGKECPLHTNSAPAQLYWTIQPNIEDRAFLKPQRVVAENGSQYARSRTRLRAHAVRIRIV